MRILVVAACPFPWPRGTPIRIHRLSEVLAGRGHHVEVVTYHLGDLGAKLPFKVHRITPISYYTKTSPGPSLTKLLLLDPMLVRLARKVCQQGQFDLIHAHHIEGLIVALSIRQLGVDLPIIYDAHTQVGQEVTSYGLNTYPKSKANYLKQKIGHWLDVSLPARANQIIAVTDELREFFIDQKCLTAREVSTVINGLEPIFLERAMKARTLPKREVSDLPTVVFAGNLASYQGIDLLLSAFAHVCEKQPLVELFIFTDDDFSPFSDQVETLGIKENIRLISIPLNELPAALVKASVLVNPRTDCSGIPQKLLNYMASGTPIVSFQGSAKVVTNRESALVVANGDVQAFANAILELLDSSKLASELGKHALDLVTTQYSWEASADKVEQIYERLLTSKQEASSL